jgi:hypothetical protein
MPEAGTKDDPWNLATAPGTSHYTMYADTESDPPLLVCQVGSTRLTYLKRRRRCLHHPHQARAVGRPSLAAGRHPGLDE